MQKIRQRLFSWAAQQFMKTQLPPGFDPQAYLLLNPDLAQVGVDPVRHYLKYGQQEGRTYSLLDWKTHPGALQAIHPATVLVVSHNADLSGAPVTALNLVQQLSTQFNVGVVLLRGGVLLEEFRAHSCWVIESNVGAILPQQMGPLVDHLVGQFQLDWAVLSSIESSLLAPSLAQRYVPTIQLIHEYAVYIRPRDKVRHSLLWASRNVFSGHSTLLNTVEELPEARTANLHLLRQGGTRRTLPSSPALEEERRRLQEAIRPSHLPPETFVVLGAGMVEFRKGIDLFIEVARQLQQYSLSRPVRFVWIGRGYQPEQDGGYSVYLQDQIRRSGLENNLVMLGESSGYDSAYAQVNAFLLTSRLDPLPNVGLRAMELGVPVLCFSGVTGLAELINEAGLAEHCLVTPFDLSGLTQKLALLIDQPSLASEVNLALAQYAPTLTTPQQYAQQLIQWGQAARLEMEQEQRDTSMLLETNPFTTSFVVPPGGDKEHPTAIARLFVRAWASGLGRRKPYPGFHPGIYREHLGLPTSHNPLAHYLTRGESTGPWITPVISSADPPGLLPPTSSVALHLHVHHLEGMEAILEALQYNTLRPDVLLTVSQAVQVEQAVQMLRHYPGRLAAVEVFPNRGRDLGPLLSGLRQHLANYTYLGHLHTKGLQGAGGIKLRQRWISYLLDNTLGTPSAPMGDRILAALHHNPRLGMVFPDDPNCVGWDQNLSLAAPLAQRWGVSSLPEFFNFPVGSMFWARVAALEPLWQLELDWSDYPPEPVPTDGTVLHALERLLPFSAQVAGFEVAVSHVPGSTR
jgi:glycosyltransferase involved in cell wall biosynthesis